VKVDSYQTRQTQRSQTAEERDNIEKVIKKTLENFRNIIQLYKGSNIYHKRTVVATLFFNRWLFDGKKHRTDRMSEGEEFICMKNKELQNKKTGNKVIKTLFPVWYPMI